MQILARTKGKRGFRACKNQVNINLSNSSWSLFLKLHQSFQ